MANTLPTHGADISASTISKWLAGFVDQLYTKNPVLNALKKTASTQKGLPQQKRAYRELDGGDYIHDTALINESNDCQWITGDEEFDPSGNEPLLPVQWPWAMIVKTAMITDFDRARNAGREKMVDMWQARVYEATQNMLKEIETRMLSASGLTGVSGYGKINGLGLLIPESPSTGVIGGIDRALHSEWQPEATTSCGAVASYYSKLSTQWVTCFTNGMSDRWDLILMGLTAWPAWEAFLQSKGQTQFQDKSDPDWGFPTLHYMGAPIIPSARLAVADQVYGLVTKDLFFAVNKNMNMVVEDVGGGPGQWIKVRKLSHMCQFGARAFRNMGVTADWA